MKSTLRLGLILLLLQTTTNLSAQKFSLDVAFNHSNQESRSGLNVSAFYHFTEKFSGGIEMNRFFPVTKINGTEEVTYSAWDFDLNFHYLLPVYKKWKWYPLAGISHTSDKEAITGDTFDGDTRSRFFSFNTGAGMLWETGRVLPHIEYNFTWGTKNQQFLLVGLTFEFGKEKESPKK